MCAAAGTSIMTPKGTWAAKGRPSSSTSPRACRSVAPTKPSSSARLPSGTRIRTGPAVAARRVAGALGGSDEGARIDVNPTHRAVDQHLLARTHARREIRDLANHGHAETAGQDGGMTLGPTLLDGHGGEQLAVDGKQVHHRRF